MKITSNFKLNPWHVSAEEFPAYGMPVEKWKFLLRYAILAPSSHNSQPWLFHLHDICLELYADYTRACPVVDPFNRELIMSCGCALFHLRTAMRHFGCLGEVEILPEADKPEFLVRLALGGESEISPEQIGLFEAIPKRRTNRQAFQPDPLPAALIIALQAAAEREGAALAFAPDQETKDHIADLIAQADALQWCNPAFRQELAKWVHPNHSKRRDGIPGSARGISDLMSYAGPLVVRTFDMGDGEAAINHQLATGSPALGVIATERDTIRDWLAAGQALARVLLRARVEDVWASFLNQPIEVPSLRMNIPHIIGRPGFPQAILRFGYGPEVNPTPRREVEDVMI